MKASTETVVTIKLELSREEALILKEYMQNSMMEEEPENIRILRESIFNALDPHTKAHRGIPDDIVQLNRAIAEQY